MKAILLFIAIFLTIHAAGQPMQKIAQLLKGKDLSAFEKYIEHQPKGHVRIRWDILRSIIDDYQEGVISIEELLPDLPGREQT